MNKNTHQTILLRLLGVALLFGLTSLMAKSFSPNIVGEYDFVRVILLAVSAFGVIGTDQAVLYYAGVLKNARQQELARVYYKMLGIVVTISVIIVLIAVLIPDTVWIYFGVKPYLIHLIRKTILILPFYSITILNTETLRATGKVIWSEWFRNIFKYIPLLVGCLLTILSVSMEQEIISWYLYGFVFLSISSFVFLHSILKNSKQEEQPLDISVKQILTVSYPIAISVFYTYLLMTIDVFFIAQYLNNEQVAFYSVGMKIMSILSLVIVAYNVNVSPELAELFAEKHKEKLQKMAQKIAKNIAITNVVIGILLLLTGKYILKYGFGEAYLEEGLNSYFILISVQILVSCFGIVPIYMNMTNRQHIFHKIMGVAVLINILLNYILIPRLGISGAAVAYAVTVLFWNIMVAVIIYRKDKVKLIV